MRKIISYGVLHFNPNSNELATEKFIETVDSLFANKSKSINSEVFLIDQGNPIKERQLINKLSKKYRCNVISLNENVGISRGINLLSHISRGQYVALVTSDVVYPPNLDEILIQELKEDQSILQICPMSDISDIQYQKGEIDNAAPLKCIAQELTIQFWPRRVFDVIGYYNEIFKATYENIDYALRLFINGNFAAISRKIKCKHYHNMTSKSGAIDQAYNNYISMPNGLDREKIKALWINRWPGINWHMMYRPDLLTKQYQYSLTVKYQQFLYLPYIQDVNY